MLWCDLCEELIVEILSRLPTKSLVRFRAVSKSLYACIGSPRFIRLHTLRSPNKLMITYVRGARFEDMYTILSEAQLSYNPYNDNNNNNEIAAVVKYPFKYFMIAGSCNGILCLQHFQYGISLWNPSIRRKVTLADRPSWSEIKGQWYPIGFGFDPLIDDYKILIRMKYDPPKIGVRPRTFVYTVKGDRWREIAFPLTTSSSQSLSSCPCLFNGSLHWVITQRYLTDSDVDRHPSSSFIYTFDLSSEVFSRIELPEPSWETNQLTIINGRLAVVSSKHRYTSKTKLDEVTWIWVLRREEECNNNNTGGGGAASSWSVAFKLNSREFEGAPSVFQLNPNGDLLIKLLYRGIIIYNPETRARLGFVGLSDALKVLRAFPCVESLELLDMGTSCDQITRNKKRSRTSEVF